LALNFAWASTESALQPRMMALSLSNSGLTSRNSIASVVHPGVLALG